MFTDRRTDRRRKDARFIAISPNLSVGGLKRRINVAVECIVFEESKITNLVRLVHFGLMKVIVLHAMTDLDLLNDSAVSIRI